MARFLALSIPSLILARALFAFMVESLGYAAGTDLPARLVLGTWVLESVGLTALFLLVQSRGPGRWMDGLAAGWVAWVFRGPLLILTLRGITGTSWRPWREAAFGWFVLYTVLGLLLVAIARAVDLRRDAP